MKFLPLVFVALLLVPFGAKSQSANELSSAQIQGQQLAREILSQRPAENTDTRGIMQIRDQGGHRSEVPIASRIMVTISLANTNLTLPDWYTCYQATLTNQTEYLWVAHTASQTNVYTYSTNANSAVPVIGRLFGTDKYQIFGPALISPFGGSDFWIADLGLEFFHWPDQKIIQHETRRTRACAVLESTNPHPSPGGYSRVDTWIDDESMGIVHAEAFDAKGKLLKIFDPKKIKKVNGQWELEDMEIRNVQTGSRTTIKFDL
jgi:hypothetical protein